MKNGKPTAKTRVEDRPSGDQPTHDEFEDVELHLYPETIRKFEALGPDWRARMAEVLDKAKV